MWIYLKYFQEFHQVSKPIKSYFLKLDFHLVSKCDKIRKYFDRIDIHCVNNRTSTKVPIVPYSGILLMKSLNLAVQLRMFIKWKIQLLYIFDLRKGPLFRLLFYVMILVYKWSKQTIILLANTKLRVNSRYKYELRMKSFSNTWVRIYPQVLWISLINCRNYECQS